MDALHADFYGLLAEVLAGPDLSEPEATGWLALPGSEWPLYGVLLRLAPISMAARRAAAALGRLEAESLEARLSRYQALFTSGGVPALWMYESGALTGRMLSPATFDVARWYRAAGLEPSGAELPDHAANELAFLAHLAGLDGQDIHNLGRAFVEQHAGLWLPALGRALSDTGDPLYAPLGQLLVDWFEELARPPRPASPAPAARPASRRRLPVIAAVSECSLCGFCVSSCPKRALAIREDEHTTRLVLSSGKCVGCNQCARACPSSTLKVEPVDAPAADISVLRESPRGTCRTCGTPLISLAELEYVSARLDNPDWLYLCQRCRDMR